MDKEKRKFPRANVNLLTRYKLYKEDSYRLVTLKNISAGGALFVTDEKLEPEDKIEVQINLPGPGRTSLSSKVVRTGQIQRSVFRFYETAVRFVKKEVNSESTQYINNIVERRLISNLTA